MYPLRYCYGDSTGGSQFIALILHVHLSAGSRSLSKEGIQYIALKPTSVKGGGVEQLHAGKRMRR